MTKNEAPATVQTNLRVPSDLLADLDGRIADYNAGRRVGRVSRTEVLVALLERALTAPGLTAALGGAEPAQTRTVVYEPEEQPPEPPRGRARR